MGFIPRFFSKPPFFCLWHISRKHTVQTILLPQKVSMVFLLPSDSILKSLVSRIFLGWVPTYSSHVIFMVLWQKDDYMSILQMRKLRLGSSLAQGPTAGKGYGPSVHPDVWPQAVLCNLTCPASLDIAGGIALHRLPPCLARAQVSIGPWGKQSRRNDMF